MPSGLLTPIEGSATMAPAFVAASPGVTGPISCGKTKPPLYLEGEDFERARLSASRRNDTHASTGPSRGSARLLTGTWLARVAQNIFDEDL